MDKGQIAEMGTHAELLANHDSIYTNLWNSQHSSVLNELTEDNLRHFKMAQTYIFWTYQNALRELLKGRKSIHVYADLMSSINLINLPQKTHEKYLLRVASYLK